MKPAIKVQRTPQQRAEEDAIRRQHVLTPIRLRPENAISRESFSAVLALVNRLKVLREQQGFTLSEVAARMGVDAPALSRLETGQTLNPTMSTILKWAEALQHTIDFELSAT